MDHAMTIGADVWRQMEDACRDADLILHTFTHLVGAHTLAHEKDIPDLHIQTFPMFTPTGDYPNITWPDWGIRVLNRFTHISATKLTWWTSQLGFERVRRRAGLPERKLHWPFDDDPLRPRTPILCAWSPSVLPPSDDWRPNVHVTGYYFLPENQTYQPPAELLSFLDGKDPPVCITFGSMVNRNKEKIDHIVRQSLKETGNRGIILSGWSGIQRPTSTDLLYLNSVPHDWLLPRCKMVVHHGGAGTTAAGLRAGIPNIVIPFMGDQAFWGKRVQAIGAGSSPIPIKKLSIANLSHVFMQAESASMCEHAQMIGKQIRNEDGVGVAVKWIEKYSNEFHR
jgi:UDP:flavonoid glycosyltransferase YjiC (YdhE family)